MSKHRGCTLARLLKLPKVMYLRASHAPPRAWRSLRAGEKSRDVVAEKGARQMVHLVREHILVRAHILVTEHILVKEQILVRELILVREHILVIEDILVREQILVREHILVSEQILTVAAEKGARQMIHTHTHTYTHTHTHTHK